MAQTQLVYKDGWGTMRFIGENLRRTKGLKFYFIFLSQRFFLLLWGFNGPKEWIIQLN